MRKVTTIKNILIGITLCAVSLVLLSINSISISIETKSESTDNNFLDGCYHVYLDMGSHNGVQIRKLFEPEKYPLAKVNPIFNEYFGPIEERRREYSDGRNVVCAVGFEPNFRHSKHLKVIERKYVDCGWRVKFLTETAVSDRSGTDRFYTDGMKYDEVSAGILPPDIFTLHTEELNNRNSSKYITLIRLSEFLINVVGKRKLPLLSSKYHSPRVLIKMDIEGSEADVIPDLIFTGALQYINLIMIEWHARYEKLPARKNAHSILKKTMSLLTEYSSSMKEHGAKFDFNSMNVDDESYGKESYSHEMPNCSI